MAKTNEARHATSAAPVTPPPFRVSRALHAPRARVFEAWTRAEHVQRWFAPEGCSIDEARVEPRLGGAFDLVMSGPGFAHKIRGRITELVPETRLVISFEVMDGDGPVLFRADTEIDFSDALCGTQLDVVQHYTVFDPALVEPMIAGAPEGWRSTLDNLEKEVIRMVGAKETNERSVAHGSFTIERRYAAPLARVWRALTDQEAKAKWFGRSPDNKLTMIERHMDVRVGGTERAKARWEGGVVSCFDAVYHDVVPEARLVYSYTMHLNEKKISVSLATIELALEGGKTRLRVTEQGAFLDGYDDAGSREHGTGFLLDALGASLKD
jgi:uncharacterized protein YndB with AHSA1/START domain